MRNLFLILFGGCVLLIMTLVFNTWANRELMAQCLAQGGVYHRSADAARSRCEFATQPKLVDKAKK